jgi:hypothetical protein
MTIAQEGSLPGAIPNRLRGDLIQITRRHTRPNG